MNGSSDGYATPVNVTSYSRPPRQRPLNTAKRHGRHLTVPLGVQGIVEAETGIEPVYRALQALA
jgi:hypothetical protein